MIKKQLRSREIEFYCGDGEETADIMNAYGVNSALDGNPYLFSL
jgi:hypothetical protein